MSSSTTTDEQRQLVSEGVPSVAAAAVLVPSGPVPEDTPVVKGEVEYVLIEGDSF